MRVAIISDIHSNLEALTEVLRVAELQKVDRIVSLGDIVGYGASPNPCCELVRSVTEITLLGNHDAAVAGRMDYSFYYDAARQALDWSASVITDENGAVVTSIAGLSPGRRLTTVFADGSVLGEVLEVRPAGEGGGG